MLNYFQETVMVRHSCSCKSAWGDLTILSAAFCSQKAGKIK
uniref:Uncharacterized protein n=1 Tax=Anguilla anguilla TaxID=7936 RepID=A0A0E9SPU9_ANGAN